MTTLDDVRRLGAAEHGLAILNATRADGSVQASLVNAGVLAHPLTGEDVVGLVAVGGAVKLRLLRARPQATITFRVGWQFATVEGEAELCGPEDPLPGVDRDRLRQLLRDVFTAAGGTHDDWDTYDKVMAEEGRTCVFIRPARLYGR
jgi:PPOX class probable F420-dependent enzyme